ncbi:MAG: FecR family protein [Jaaginema sp. PMC 1079.18]|nr:FecR family protein [Jaaginema sp. PMC 1080.18]MEC4851818.1 FecR family protein [Jaaginema sp. PMC 1079.18]MEC4865994.1 FecR family protein [Jaaginema sp. PMC 1078.18]
MTIQYWRFSVIGIAISGLIFACSPEQSAVTSSTQSPEVTASNPDENSQDGEITTIQQQPVFVTPLSQEKEISGQEGMALKYGETIRTQGDALAEINLNNGLAFRIGGDSILTLQPNNELHLKSGEMITWVEEGKEVPVKIITPGGIAGIRGTTVHVEYSETSDQIRFFSWEGTVAVTLPNQDEEIILNSGDEVLIEPGETEIAKIRDRVRHLPLVEWQKRRAESRLLKGFAKELPTIEKIKEVDRKMLEKGPMRQP